jgi:mono/diheme cytochrome c family protein
MVTAPLLWSLLLLTIQRPTIAAPDPVPKLWDDAALASMTLPAAIPGTRILYLSSDSYYRIPERRAWRSYPVYAPGKEPHGYIEWLRTREPEFAFDQSKLKSEKDWVGAGEILFDTPYNLDPLDKSPVREPEWWNVLKAPLKKDGSITAMRYVIRSRGVIEVGGGACSACHGRVMPGGNVIFGAQGNFPMAAVKAYHLRKSGDLARKLTEAERGLNAALVFPEIPKDDLSYGVYRRSVDELARAYEAVIPGMAVRPGFSMSDMPKIADLIGLKGRKFLDMTARLVQRGPSDIMRYAAGCGGENYFFSSLTNLPPEAVPPITNDSWRPSDAAYYAITLYVYSLSPPPNPDKPKTAADRALVRRGSTIFKSEGCFRCHDPNQGYTNNKLIAADGYEPPDDHPFGDDIVRTLDGKPRRIGVDSRSAVVSHRGRGFYKVPSLLGVWYRGPLEHNGSVATLEDWFDERRMRANYVPTGFKGVGVQTRAVKGHEFGLDLPADEKAALIAFLRSL